MAAFGATPVQARQLSCDERAVQEPLRDVDEKDCTAEEGEAHTLLYILFLEQELTKAKARLAVFRAEARQQEKVRLARVRGIELPLTPEPQAHPEVEDRVGFSARPKTVPVGGTSSTADLLSAPPLRRGSACQEPAPCKL